MSNASLKDQLQAVASQLSDTLVTEKVSEKRPAETKSTETKHVASQKHHPKPKRNPNTNHSSAKSDKANAAKPNWLVYVQYGVELLRAYFPQCFKTANDVKPLKKGIKQDLIKQLSTMEQIVIEDKACMVKSLSYYVNTASYHKGVVEGAVRIDLDGKPSGSVSAEEAKYSTERHQARLQLKQGAPKTNSSKPTQDQVEVI